MRIVLWLSIILATGLYIVGPIDDPDLWWHITVGKWMLAHAQIPHADHWNMFAAGKPWRAYSWSAELLFAAIDGRFGIHGLLVLKSLIAVLLAGSLCYCFGRIANDRFLGGILGVYATAACFNHFTLRPQTLVWVYFAWLLLTLSSIDRAGMNRWNRAALVLLFCAWANTHVTAVLGVTTVVLWLARRARIRTTVEGSALAIAGTLITPYLGGEWVTFFETSRHPFTFSAIAEFQPATILQYSTAFLVVIGVLVLLFLHYRPLAVSPGKLLLALLFTLGALAVVKFLPMAVIVLCAVACEFWAAEAADHRALGNIAEAIDRLRAGYEWLPANGLAFVFLSAAAVNFFPRWQQPYGHVVTPIMPVDFIEAQQLPHPILSGFGQGGYLMYRFSDADGNLDHLVAIDGRTNVNPPEVWTKYYNAMRGLSGWREYFDLVQPQTVLWRNESPLTAILLALPQEWRRVYCWGRPADGFSVFVRTAYFESRGGALAAADCGAEQ